MKQKVLLLFCVILLSCGVYAQRETYNWFFGANCGLTWNETRSYAAIGMNTANTTLHDLPKTITSSIATSEGCFSLSDRSGQVLFYSDGISIWNKENNPMPNANGSLTGHSSSTQSGIIIPYPKAHNKYIAITLGQGVTNNLSYSVIDMTLENGLGDVTNEKNIKFLGHGGLLGETVTAVRHANKADYWVVAVGRGNPTYFNAWLVTKDGPQVASPVTSFQSPLTNTATNPCGYFKFSPNGKHFAWQAYNVPNIVYGDFDTNTGIFSNVKSKSVPAAIYGNWGYSLEFSNSGKYLYLSWPNAAGAGVTSFQSALAVFNFEDLLVSSATNYIKLLVHPSGSNVSYGALQMGPDGRMYCGRTYTDGMYVIDNPEDPENLRVYRLDNFVNGTVLLGLPSFTSAWFDTQIIGPNPPDACINKVQTFSLEVSKGSGQDEISHTEWDFGDDQPGSVITDTDMAPASGKQEHSYTYTKPGTYTITVKSFLVSDGSELPMARQTFEINIYRCVMPVNPNIHIY